MSTNPPSIPPLSRLTLSIATVAFALAGALTGLLAWHTLSGEALLPGCGGPADCTALASTRWAYWGPVPVALPAVFLYAAAVLGLCLVESMPATRFLNARRRIWAVVMTVSWVSIGAALWFALLQGLLLRRLCIYCLAIHVCACCGGGVVLRAVRRGAPPFGLGWRLPLFLAAGALTLLVAGQWLLPSKAGRPLEVAPARATAAGAVASLALAPGDLVLARGKVRLNAAAYPVLGLASPRHVVAVLYDYTCEACRANHRLLTESLGRYGSQVGIMMVPTPLDPACNLAIERLAPEHVNACLYARYALAVWQAAPEKFAAFDAWVMAGGARPPAIEEARRQAEALVGAERFHSALEAPRNQQALRDSGRLYQALEAGEIPKLLLPDDVLVGGFATAEQLHNTLEKQLGVRPGGR